MTTTKKVASGKAKAKAPARKSVAKASKQPAAKKAKPAGGKAAAASRSRPLSKKASAKRAAPAARTAAKKSATKAASKKAPAPKTAAKPAVKAAAKPAAGKAAPKAVARLAAKKPTDATKKTAPKSAPKPAVKKPEVKKAVEAAKAPVAKPAPAPAKAAAPAPKPPVKPPVKLEVPVVPPKAAAPSKPSKPFSAKKLGDFAVNDFVVYPTHGVGQIDAIEEQTIAGYTLRLFVIRFEKEKMTLRVPVGKAEDSGLRKLSTRQQIDVALTTLRGRSRVSRAMWSRRAQEYEAKINSGDPVSIAEVVRDLHRNAGQPDQSYSERQIYEAALERLARELAAVEHIDADAATVKLEQVLVKAA